MSIDIIINRVSLRIRELNNSCIL